jgi:hypothetical protein
MVGINARFFSLPNAALDAEHACCEMIAACKRWLLVARRFSPLTAILQKWLDSCQLQLAGFLRDVIDGE